MKTDWRLLIVLVCAVGLCWSGCDTGVEDTPAPPPETGPQDEAELETEKPQPERRGYIGTVVRAPASAMEKTAVLNVNNTLQQYRTLHGDWPDSLETLEEWTNAPLPDLPAGRHYHYDPETGEVKIRLEQK